MFSLRLTIFSLFLSCILADKDYYGILEITTGPDTPDSEVRSRYKKLSRTLHPDRNPNQSEEDRQRYKDVQEAYTVLSDRKKRRVYDMMGHEGLKQLEQQSHHGRRQNSLSSFFGFGGGDGGPERGPDITLTMRVSLDDIYNGAEHVVPIVKQKLKNFDVVKKCMKCKAQPPQRKRVSIGPGMVMQQEVPPDCRKPCSANAAVKRKQVEMEVNIEAGTPEGHELNYELEADEYPDRLPGDVKFIVETAPHPTFKRDGDNLEMTLSITLLEALVGFEKTLKHMDGHEVTIARSEPTSHGQTLVLQGEGMPKHHVPSDKGDLIVTFAVNFPKKLSNEQKEQFKKLLG